MTLSPADFMAQPPDPEEELDATGYALEGAAVLPLIPDPLTSIATSLSRLVEHFDCTSPQAGATDEMRDAHQVLLEQHDDLLAEHVTLRALLEEIETIIKPSTSKLANQVRAAIEAWRAPEVPAAVKAGGELEHPSHDAPVEEWREFARDQGYNGPDVDTMNRSQIRSMLDIEQPGTPVAPSVVHA